MRLKDKVTLITGAGSGQGQVAAVLFAREGARLGICDLDAAGLAETERQVRAAGGEVVATVGSVAKADEVREILGRTVAAFGRLDVLYNNAGIYWPHRGDGPVDTVAEDAWQTVIDTNLKGVYLCAKHAVPELRKAGGGAIVNIASMAGVRGTPHAHAYAASKGGVIALTYSMAATYGRDGIRVNAIAPGAIDTPMVQPFLPNAADPERLQQSLQRIPLGRHGQPQDVAHLALFLASDESAWISGTVIQITGGGHVL
jgi:NAD(P)-dependent dehydrogenase (short-subunit alcohol dehydrogenase family)